MCLTSAAMGGARRDVREAGMRLDWVTGLNDPQSKLTQEIPNFLKTKKSAFILSNIYIKQENWLLFKNNFFIEVILLTQ